MTVLTIARVAGLFCVLAIIALSLVPGVYRPHTGLPGKAEHFIAYCSTGTVFALGFRSRGSRVVIALGLTLLAGLMEILQMWVPGRHPAIADAVVSSMGGLLGIALGGLSLPKCIRSAVTSAHRPGHFNNSGRVRNALTSAAPAAKPRPWHQAI
jgi:VanZ family protein